MLEIVKTVGDLTAEEYEKCRSLNAREAGYMRQDLPRARKLFPKKALVVMLYDDHTLIAWAFAYPKEHGYSAQVYTRVRYRRRGYGKRALTLMRGLLKEDPEVYPHDGRSSQFFKSQRVTLGHSYKGIEDVRTYRARQKKSLLSSHQ